VFGWFGKLWRALSALWRRAVGRNQPELLFFVDSLRGAYWTPATKSGTPMLQMVIHLEVTNTSDGAYRIMAARLRWWRKPQVAIIGVEDFASRTFAHDHPIPGHRVARASVNFLFEKRPPANPRNTIKVTLVLTDHLAEEHRVRVELR
jgi:hypothetical protein